MAMTFEQYKELRKKGYSQEQLQKLNTENKPKGFFQKLGASLSKRKSNITNEAQNFASGSITKPEYYLRGTGQVAGAFGDVVGQAVGAAGKFAFNALPGTTQSVLKTAGTKALQSKPGQLAMGGLQAGADKYGRFAEANPRLATNLAAVGNIATAVPIGKGVGMAGREVVDTAIDVGNITKRIGTPNVDRVIETGVMKGIKPSVVGKNTLNQVGRYKDQAKQAVLNIVKNKKNLTYTDEFGEVTGGRVPESLKEASEAIDQTKRSIFKEYNTLTKKAGSAGSTIDLNGVVNELKTIVDDPVMRTVSPQSVSYAEKMMENLSKQGTFTPEQAQKAIENLNESLQTFYKNPSFNSYSNVQIDALIANQLRKSLDEVVTGATGKEYQELKNAYASLKAIEKDVLKRAVVEGRKNAKGLIDFTDIFSAGDIIAGVTTMNPALIAKGGIQKAVASYFKGLNSPDKAIKKMFKGVEKSIEKGREKFVPKSNTFKLLNKAKGKGGMSIQDISRSGIEVSEKQWEKLNNSAFIEALNDYGKKLEQTLNKEKRSPKINLDKIDKLEDAFDDVKAAKKTKGALSPEAAKLWSARFKKLGIDFDEYYSLPQAMGMQKNTFTKGERGRFTGSKSMKSTDPLLQEAREYESAEEFVKAKVNAYHGSPSGELSTIKPGAGEQKLSVAYISKEPGTAAQYTGTRKLEADKLMAAREAAQVDYEATNSAQSLAKLEVIDKKLSALVKESQTGAVTSIHFSGNSLNPIKDSKKIISLFENADTRTWTPLEQRAVSNIIHNGGSELSPSLIDRSPNIRKFLSENGVDGLEYPHSALPYSGGENGTQIAVLNNEKLLTKSQLTDLWKKATKKKGR